MTSGRRAATPRIAVLVYNDAANDSRVLKESASLRDAGYEVRIIAVERRELGRDADVTTLGKRLTLERVPEFAIERILPALAPHWRRLISGADAAAERPSTSSPAQALRHPSTPLAGMKAGLLRGLRSVGERAYRTVALGTYWKNATAAGLWAAPDVIHANDGNTLVPALLIRALSRGEIAVVYDSHELWRHRNVRPDRWLAPLLETVTEAIGIRRADGVITVSPSIAAWLRDTYRLAEEPTLVRNVPVADALPSRSTGVLRERAGLAEQHRVIAYGGRITSARGIEETIAALPHLDEDVHFVLLGYGERAALDQVRAEAARHGVTDRVHLVGAVAPDDVSRSLADGDVAVVHVRPICLSYRYALPNKLFESIRAGLPIAAADLPDMRQVVEELGVGEVFRGSSPQDLAEALAAVLESPETYRERARAVAPQLTWEHETEPMLALYERVLAARQAARR
ncbi:MAG: glycosyltransferase [Brachybacterium sp.]|uniref:glycosyltransferase n=1 Tax=Brachybacterium sp. TaxID=1891286 RepID=UPI0026486FA3|nr:glycosyltransferase [Brachybacterium sp.]MDN5686482.1 glycosyltransferase [Brachybacterium sp.]